MWDGRQHSEFFTAVFFIEYARRFDGSVLQQDGAPPHFGGEMAKLAINWAQRTKSNGHRDLRTSGPPADYFVRGNSKYFVYRSCQRTSHDLKISVLLLETSHLRVSNVRDAV